MIRSFIAISSDGLLTPSLDIHLSHNSNSVAPYGWGIAWHPDNKAAALLYKQTNTSAEVSSTNEMPDIAAFRSKTFICKAKTDSAGYTHHEIQPFSKSFAGNDWLFAHCGNIDKNSLRELFTSDSKFLTPLGRSDSELAFCFLLGKFYQEGLESIKAATTSLLLSWLAELDKIGVPDITMSDGTSMLIYRGEHSQEHYYFSRITPSETKIELESSTITANFQDPRDIYRTKFILSNEPFSTGQWEEIKQGQLLIVSNGAITSSDIQASLSSQELPISTKGTEPEIQKTKKAYSNMQVEQTQSNQVIMNSRSVVSCRDAGTLTYRMFNITHITEYSYTEPVEHSSHIFRLKPLESPIQSVEYSTLTISSPGEQIQFEDVFGNESLHYTITEPYTHLKVENHARVRIYGRPNDDTTPKKRQASIPLVWMPWQRQMMMPYLLPQELPPTQLEELTTYAMSFVERNDYDLLETLRDINHSIYTDYEYLPGKTSLDTTPFDVYATRHGVCQDFANLFICLARLLGVPARYQMGYIYTGASYENKIQSEASHAWVELYLPYIGWRGFDPTNGCLAKQEHISVARGRNYLDATPTSGTIFKGGGTETLGVTVKVEEVYNDQ
ncbi:MAG: transglutaminase [Waddliaceae bacterium]|nr:transglutaminase [Waddliaceae bacterium]